MSDQAMTEFYAMLVVIMVFIAVACIPATIARFAVAKEPLSKRASAGFAFLSFIVCFTFLWSLASEGQTVSPIGPGVALFLSWWICRYEKQRIW